MNFTRSKIRVIVLVAGLIGVALFNRFNDPGPSSTYRALDNWIKVLTDEKRAHGTLPSGVNLRLAVIGSDQSFDWLLSSSSAGTSDQILRILELTREASPRSLAVLNPGIAPPPPGEDEILLSIDGGQSKFAAIIPRKEFESNIKIQNMVKLFELAEISRTQTALKQDAKPRERKDEKPQ